MNEVTHSASLLSLPSLSMSLYKLNTILLKEGGSPGSGWDGVNILHGSPHGADLDL